MKVLVEQCDRKLCGGREEIVLRSKDDKHHLCGGCVRDLLNGMIDPANKGEPPAEGEEEINICDFCLKAKSGEHWTMHFATSGEDGGRLHVCDSCLIKAARLMGNLRIVKDC